MVRMRLKIEDDMIPKVLNNLNNYSYFLLVQNGLFFFDTIFFITDVISSFTTFSMTIGLASALCSLPSLFTIEKALRFIASSIETDRLLFSLLS